LGDGTITDKLTPVTVVGLTSGVHTISAGFYHSCALMTSGGVKCWGRNSDGGLGDGTFATRLMPVNVTGLTSGVTGVVAIFYYSCAFTSGGAAKCWGYNFNGELGDGTKTRSNLPVDVIGLSSGVINMAGGGNH